MPGKGNQYINHNNVVHAILCNVPIKMTIGKSTYAFNFCNCRAELFYQSFYRPARALNKNR